MESVGRTKDVLATALSVAEAALASLDRAFNLYEMVILGLTTAIVDHASSVLAMATEAHTRSLKVLLRTITELWMILSYVEADETGERAASYVNNGPSEARRLLVALRRLADENPSDEERVLASAGFASRKELEQSLASIEEGLNRAKDNGVPPLPSVADCAKAAGLEIVYRSVYGFLLSQQVHGRADDTLRELVRDSDRSDELYRVLLSTLYELVGALKITCARLGSPSEEEVGQLQQLVDEAASYRARPARRFRRQERRQGKAGRPHP